MNYFAHGYRFVHDPFFLAGTAVPDWLSVVNRRVRARQRLAEPWTDHADPGIRGLAAGIVQHHRDDAWFHVTRAFAELSLSLTAGVREELAGDPGFRPSFLGHILVEVFLDAALIEEDVNRLAQYYEALESLDPVVVSETIQLMTTAPIADLPVWIPRFCRERFLYDYLDDAKLLARLNRVMGRVKLPSLPTSFVALLPVARQRVYARREELLTEPNHFSSEGT
jgi:hypothetical protein